MIAGPFVDFSCPFYSLFLLNVQQWWVFQVERWQAKGGGEGFSSHTWRFDKPSIWMSLLEELVPVCFPVGY